MLANFKPYVFPVRREGVVLLKIEKARKVVPTFVQSTPFQYKSIRMENERWKLLSCEEANPRALTKRLLTAARLWPQSPQTCASCMWQSLRWQSYCFLCGVFAYFLLEIGCLAMFGSANLAVGKPLLFRISPWEVLNFAYRIFGELCLVFLGLEPDVLRNFLGPRSCIGYLSRILFQKIAVLPMFGRLKTMWYPVAGFNLPHVSQKHGLSWAAKRQ